MSPHEHAETAEPRGRLGQDARARRRRPAAGAARTGRARRADSGARTGEPAGGFKHLNLRIPSDVHKTLRKISIDDDKSLKAVVIEALTRYAAAHGKET